MTEDVRVTGIHHLTFVVSDLAEGISWFERALRAEHIPRFDHHDASGELFGVVLSLAGLPAMIELRVATADYPLRAGYDPVTFEVANESALQAWVSHLDRAGVEHTPIKQRRTGQSLEFETPDGTLLRLFTAPAGGFDEVAFQESHVDE
jgi:catechol 2,3-dioxygenase-like lactoylglutathione lyase family enzyme